LNLCSSIGIVPVKRLLCKETNAGATRPDTLFKKSCGIGPDKMLSSRRTHVRTTLSFHAGKVPFRELLLKSSERRYFKLLRDAVSPPVNPLLSTDGNQRFNSFSTYMGNMFSVILLDPISRAVSPFASSITVTDVSLVLSSFKSCRFAAA
jgi:hypothetical protein